MDKTSHRLIILLAVLQLLTINCSNNPLRPKEAVLEKNPRTPSDDRTPPDDRTTTSTSKGGMVDFVTASRIVTPAVVHIKTMFNDGSAIQQYGIPGSNRRAAIGSGSGVIILEDGYIATNNHVVENATSIEVILPDKRVFSATLVGRDPNTDLALLKVNAKNLPTVLLGNSDIVQVGEWVLAVGYPFSLNTTVTAGIISAKARSLGIINRPGSNNLQGNMEPTGNTAIESFIQTDAAINPGNSGGALVNTSGELIGINAAIASQTGSYAGYAFAIPVNLAKKILNDLRKYGAVKRGVLGVSFPAPSTEEQYLKQQGLTPGAIKGVYITNVQQESAASVAGLKEGDIIQKIDGIQLNSSSEFSERIARHQPGDTINLAILRNGKTSTTTAILKEESKSTPPEKNGQSLEKIYSKLGATFAPMPDALKRRYQLNSGVLVTGVQQGGFFNQVGIPPGTIIAYINGRPINNPKDIDAALLGAQRGIIQIFAIGPDGSRVVFDFSLGT